MYFKRIVQAKISKSFNKDLFELGTGGVGINLRLFPSIALCIPTAHNFTRD